MKIRKDFVTNSSSSSYIIAFKGFPEIDEKTLRKYPLLGQFKTMLHDIIYGQNDYYETSEAKEYTSLQELQQYLIDEYEFYLKNETVTKDNRFDILCKKSEYIKSLYEKCVPYLNSGYHILMKDIDYNDEMRSELFASMECDDFIILEQDG